MRILIVEDEVRLAEALGEIMKAQRYAADIVYDGESAFDNAMSGIYDCIILDVMIPKMDGFEVVRKMRQEKNTTPVIMLTAKDDTVDKIKGLDAGALPDVLCPVLSACVCTFHPLGLVFEQKILQGIWILIKIHRPYCRLFCRIRLSKSYSKYRLLWFGCSYIFFTGNHFY